MPNLSELIQATPAGSLTLGVRSCSDRAGVQQIGAVIEGSSAGFRMLARILEQMADHVDDAGSAWVLGLSSEDTAALETVGVTRVTLDCQSPTS